MVFCAKGLNGGLGTNINEMTLILGMRYDQGLVLIGDTKVMDGKNNFHHENKIVNPVENVNVAVGCAGFTQLAKEFNVKINFQVQTRISQVRLANMRDLNGTGKSIEEIEEGKITNVTLPYAYKAIDFLDDCALLTAQLAATGKVYDANPMESLVIIGVGDMIELYQIDCNGFKVQVPYASIGSGTMFIGDFLKKNYRDKMPLYDCILLGTFLIKYVETLEWDSNVGLEAGQLPQIFIISDNICKNYEIPKQDKDKILKEVQDRITNIRKNLLLFPNEIKLIEKPIWGKSKRPI